MLDRSQPQSQAAPKIERLRCEYLTDPQGIDTAVPRLSWIISSKRRGEKQTAYQVLVSSSPRPLKDDRSNLWDSGKVCSDESAQVPYAGRSLASRQECFWKVRTWDRDGQPSDWSKTAHWQMGLLDPKDWKAKWITVPGAFSRTGAKLKILRATYGQMNDAEGNDVTLQVAGQVKDNRLVLVNVDKTFGAEPVSSHLRQLKVEYEVDSRRDLKQVQGNGTLAIPQEFEAVHYLRRSFLSSLPVQRATLYVSALGLYEVHINGHRVGDQVLAPDWTDYRKRVRYQTYDVTALLQSGDNAIGAFLANGWYSGHFGNGGFQFFGKAPAFSAQLEITYANGQTQSVVTDESWKSHRSPILSSDFMWCEDYDARFEISGWDQPGLDDNRWLPVETRAQPGLCLEAQLSEPVRKICELKPKSVTQPKPGSWVFDLGQNMVGVTRLKVSAPRGTTITLRHAEMLNPDGTLYTRNLRCSSSVDHYTCKGDPIEIWQPRFTYHGFRYVELTGLHGKPGADAVTGVVIGSDTPRAGRFACSDPRLNQLQSNIQWTQRGNFLSVPTDCPQRDERLGWMGDAQISCRTATYNSDVAAFFTKWLRDVADGQSEEGAFSDVSPNTMRGCGVPGWGDAGVICPWTIYEVYDDQRVLERHLPDMIEWVDYLGRHTEQLIRTKDRGGDYGDWLAIGSETPKDLIGTAFFAYSTLLVAKSCEALGRGAEAQKYQRQFSDIKAAFIKEYISKDGHIRGNTQTAYALALKFDLFPDDLRPKAAEFLAQDINSKGNHLSTGLLGTGYLLPVLTDCGKEDAAYRLLFQDTFPSWLYSVKHGATTIWERWDGWTPEKGFQSWTMNSFNQFALGSCGEYLFGYIGGIRPSTPGFKNILIQPAVQSPLSWATTSYDSIHGRIATIWELKEHRLALEVIIPANTTATVCVPAKNQASVSESGKPTDKSDCVKFVRMDQNKAVFQVGSGAYRFLSEM